MKTAVWVLPVFLLAQDDPTPRALELIRQLGDERPENRQRAEEELVRMGPRVLPALRNAVDHPDPELSERVKSAIRRIELAEKLKNVLPEPKLVTLDVADMPLSQVAKSLETQTGLRFLNVSHRSDPIRLRVTRAALLETLDQISAQIKNATFQMDSETTVTLADEPYIPFPSSYSGPFRLRIIRMEREVTDTYDKRTVNLRFTLSVDWEKTAKPLDSVTLSVVHCETDEGAAINVQNPPGGRAIRRGMGIVVVAEGSGPSGEHNMFAEDIPPTAKSIRSMKVRGTFRFPLDYIPVEVPEVKPNKELKVGEFKLRIRQAQSNYIECWLVGPDLAMANLGDIVDINSFEGSNKKNESIRLNVTHAGMTGGDSQMFYLMWQGGGRLDRFKFNLREVQVRNFDFELRDLELPR